METHRINLDYSELRTVNQGWNGRVLAETTSGLPVFIHNPLYEVRGPGSDAVAVPIDDALAGQLRDHGHGLYTTPDRAYEFRIFLR